MSLPPGLWLFVLAAALTTGLCLLGWRLRKRATGQAFFFAMLCGSLWVVFFIFETLAPSLEEKLFFAKIQFVGITLLPPAWLNLAWSYSGQERKWRTWLPVLIVPALTNLLVWVIPPPNPFWGTPSLDYFSAPFPVLVADYGWWFYYIHAPYGYLIVLMAGTVLLGAMKRLPAIYRYQVALLLLAVVLPLAADVIYVLGYSPIRYYNFTTALFSVSGIVIAWSLFYYRLLDLAPLARDLVVDNLDDGVIVFDDRGRIIDANRAAQRVVGLKESIVGMDAAKLAAAMELKAAGEAQPGSLSRAIAESLRDERTPAEFQLNGRIYELRLSPVRNGSGVKRGQVAVFRDITEGRALFDRVQELARRDELTGIMNRRQLLEEGRREFERVLRYPDASFSVLHIDVDQLKEINDTYGHSAGDQALKAFASLCARQVRASDILGRWGGDEFVVLMPNTGLAGAQEAAQRLHERLKETRVPVEGGEIALSVSIGVVCWQDLAPRPASLDELFHQADLRLYQAKKEGRNRVV